MPTELIGLSTVPPNAPPAPKLWYDLPYAVALRDFFSGFRIRAQQNTRYIESDVEEAVRTHTIDTLISILTGADIQSTITPDEGRNVPWHYNNIRGVQTVKQTWAALDGIGELRRRSTAPGRSATMVRDIQQRAVVFLEEILEVGGYFAAVEKGFFVDSAQYPERTRRRDRPGRPGRRRRGHHRRRAIPTTWPPSATTSATTPCRRASARAVRPDRRLHAVRPVEDRLHRRAGPRGQRRAPAGPDRCPTAPGS